MDGKNYKNEENTEKEKPQGEDIYVVNMETNCNCHRKIEDHIYHIVNTIRKCKNCDNNKIVIYRKETI